MLGLVVGAVFGCLFAKTSTVQKPLPVRRRASNFSTGSLMRDDPVSNLMNQMQTGVQLIAESQRNYNLREAIAIKSDRLKLERDYLARFPN